MYYSGKERWDWDFLVDSIIDGNVLWIIYQCLLFRCPAGWTYAQSNGLLVGLMAGSILLGNAVLFRNHRTRGTMRAVVILPVGVYTLLIYWKTMDWRWHLPLLLGAGAALLYTILCMARKIPQPERKKQIIKRRLYRCWWVSCELLTGGVALLLAGLLINLVLGVNLFLPRVRAVVGTSPAGTEQTLSEHAMELQSLQEETWAALTLQQKLDVLQMVANIEAQELGLPQEVRVGGSVLEEDVLAQYADRTHTVKISLDHLETAGPLDVLDSVLHECYHAYQHRLVDLYEAEKDPAMLQLKVFRSVAQYAYEFTHYEGEDDRAYYEQACETDARRYARQRTYDYLECMDSVMEEQPAEESAAASEEAA